MIPPSVEEISPTEAQQLAYVSKPPSELGKLLFSYEVSRQQRNNYWSNYNRGKWVVWSGKVTDVIPKLNPTRAVFLYDYEEPPLSSPGEFGVIVHFHTRWTEYLKGLSEGETVYYRARLTERHIHALYKAGKYRSSPYFLELEDGDIIANDDIRARLVDLAYTGYDQLDTLVEQAEVIAAISKFFEGKLSEDRKQRAVETVIKLATGVDVSEKYWHLEETPLLELRAKKNSLKSSIEEQLQEALVFHHFSDTLANEKLYQEIEDTIRRNNNIVEASKDASKVLKDFWEEERQSAKPGISDLALDVLLLKFPPASATKTIMEGIIEEGKLNTYEIIVGVCHLQLESIKKPMEQIRDNVVKMVDNVIQ